MMRCNQGELQFEWDDDKGCDNVKKHGVTFDEAMEVFEDPHRARDRDKRNDYGEVRWHTVGMTRGGNKTLVVAYTRRVEDGEEVTRIISAWQIGDRGRRRYGYRETKAK